MPTTSQGLAGSAWQFADDVLDVAVQSAQRDVVDAAVQVYCLDEVEFQPGFSREGEGEEAVYEASGEDQEEECWDLVDESVQEWREWEE